MDARGVDRFGERPKGDASLLQLLDEADQMRQRSAEPIEFPDDQDVAFARIGHTRLEARPVITCARGAIVAQVPLVDACTKQGIALQVDRLALVTGRYPHTTTSMCDKPQIGRCHTP